MPTHVLIYASSGLRAEAWRALLASLPEFIVISATADLTNPSVRRVEEHPATLLIDTPDPTQDLVRHIKAALSGPGLLLLVDHYDPDAMLPLLQAGASGFVALTEAIPDLARAITAVGRGEIVLPPALAPHLLARLARGDAPVSQPVEPLSERELEVVRLLAQGLTNKDIAQSLFLSVRTVEAHLRSIFGKLGVRSRTEAALWAIQRGYGFLPNR